MSKAIRQFTEFPKPSEDQNIPSVGWQTDIMTVFPEIFAGAGSSKTADYVILNAINDEVGTSWYTDESMDTTRDMVITLAGYRGDAGGDDIDGDLYIFYVTCDGSEGDQNLVNGDELIFPGCDQSHSEKMSWTIDSSDVHAGAYYNLYWVMKETKGIYMRKAIVRYYVKRQIS